MNDYAMISSYFQFKKFARTHSFIGQLRAYVRIASYALFFCYLVVLKKGAKFDYFEPNFLAFASFN